MDALQALEEQGRRQEIKVGFTHFKGLPGEKLEPHLLTANDWLENNRIPEHEKPHDLGNTLVNVAQNWYDDIVVPVDRNAM